MLPENANGAVREKQLRESCTELARKLRAGDDCKAEDFLPDPPLAPSEADASLELIYTEFVIREELGQQPKAADWLARFPHLRDRLARLFPIGALLNEQALMDAPTIANTPSSKPADTPNGPLSAQRWVDDYQLLERIGRGGMGVVYRARQIGLDRIVALKMISAGDGADAAEQARFRREAENVARLHHPNIVQIYSVGERDGQPFFSMEFAEGGSLARRIAGAPQPSRQSAQWLETLARAMHYAHQQGLVHRDLKPGNVVFSADGVPKITDFGLAKRLEASMGKTLSVPLLGTPSYIAPEQAANQESSALCDVYSLGAILYELLTGKPPFLGDSPFSTVEQVLHEEPVAPRTVNPHVDQELEAICLKCLEKKAKHRYATAEALADDLARWLRGEPTVARPYRWSKRTWRALRRHPLVSTAGALLFLTAVITPAVAYFRDSARHLEHWQRELRSGHPITMIPEMGTPKWSRLIATDPNTTASLGFDGTYAVEARDLALVELVPDPQCQDYRFSVELRHDMGSSSLEGQVGVYFAYNKLPHRDGKGRHYFCSLSFNDLFLEKKPIEIAHHLNSVELSLQRFPDMQDGEQGHRVICRRRAFQPAGKMPGLDPWCQLTVEVTPSRVQAFWRRPNMENQLVGELSSTELRKMAKLPEWDPVGCDTGSALGGALGIYVYQSTASFRRAVVEPLVPEN